MRVLVLVAIRYGEGCYTEYPPSVWQLQRCVRARCSACFHATCGGLLWTRDALFGVLRRQHTGAAPVATPQTSFAFFTALLDIGECEEEVDLVAMLLTELCARWPSDIAAHLEVCRADAGLLAVNSVVPSITREETLLLLFADEVDATPATQAAFLSRWGVEAAWDYTTAVQGRCWLMSGGVVAMLPADPIVKVVTHFWESALAHTRQPGPPMTAEDGTNCDWDVGCAMENALARAVLEQTLTRALKTRVVEAVRHAVECRPLHRCVAAVPPAMALFLRQLPSGLLHECVLYHTVDCPLAPLGGNRRARPLPGLTSAEDGVVVAPVRSGNTLAATQQHPPSSQRYRVADEESLRLADLFHEYDLLLSNQAYVRVPLAPVTRYVFAQLLCRTELPAALMLPFVRQHSAAVSRIGPDVAGLDGSPSASEEELVLGIKLTWAVSRWTAAMGQHATATTLFTAWNTHRTARQEGIGQWVQRRMRAARKAVTELHSIPDEMVDAASATTAVRANAADEDAITPVSSWRGEAPMQRQRIASLQRLEEKLFDPYQRTYRGSSTEWVEEALRDVGAEQARAALSVAPDATGTAGEVRSDTTSDAGSVAEDATSETSSTTTVDEEAALMDSAAEQDETACMLAQLAELESVLERELEEREAGCSAASPNGSDVASWLSSADMQDVARNEMFQRHVHLLESEMASRARPG